MERFLKGDYLERKQQKLTSIWERIRTTFNELDKSSGAAEGKQRRIEWNILFSLLHSYFFILFYFFNCKGFSTVFLSTCFSLG